MNYSESIIGHYNQILIEIEYYVEHCNIKHKMSATIRRSIRQRENFEMARGWTPKEKEAMSLRRLFVKTFIVDFDTTLYTTRPEREWAYIAKREYRYDVTLKSTGMALLTANVLWSYSIWRAKKIVWWPLAVAAPAFLYFQQYYFKKHSKKLFDMCNIGEEYYLGLKRNEVLRKCNQILDSEDF